MELHERLNTSKPVTGERDPFAEVKSRVHFTVIGDLGPQLYNVSMDVDDLRERVLADVRDQRAQETGISRDDRKRLTLDDMIKLGTLSQETVEFLQRCIKAQLNMLISGGTGSGKTTLMNALSTAIPNEERIVTIEDAAELRLNQDHVLRLESRPKDLAGENEIPIRALVRNSLRMRPDRIIVGEVRGAEALDRLQAMNTGHDGSLATIHSNTPRDALALIEPMVLMAGYDLP